VKKGKNILAIYQLIYQLIIELLQLFTLLALALESLRIGTWMIFE